MKKVIYLSLMTLLLTGCGKTSNAVKIEEENNEVVEVQKLEAWQEEYNKLATKQEYDDKCYYYLTDLNNDNIPEMIISKGSNESDMTGEIYSYTNGEIKSYGTISLMYSKLYNEDKLIRESYHKEQQMIYSIELDSDKFIETLLEEKEVDEENKNTYNNELERYNINDLTPIETYKEA